MGWVRGGYARAVLAGFQTAIAFRRGFPYQRERWPPGTKRAQRTLGDSPTAEWGLLSRVSTREGKHFFAKQACLRARHRVIAKQACVPQVNTAAVLVVYAALLLLFVLLSAGTALPGVRRPVRS